MEGAYRLWATFADGGQSDVMRYATEGHAGAALYKLMEGSDVVDWHIFTVDEDGNQSVVAQSEGRAAKREALA